MAPTREPSDTASPRDRVPRLAYVASRYPAVSHTFIQREVAGLRRAGVQVDTYALRGPAPDDLLTADNRREAARTVSVRPVAAHRFALQHLRALARAPVPYLRTLAYALGLGSDARGRLRQVLYFAQAVPIWRHCVARGTEHVHAHFERPSADVALLVARLGRPAGRGRSEPWPWSFTAHSPQAYMDLRAALARKVTAADAVVCVSEYGRRQLGAIVAPEHRGKLRVIHCGIELGDVAERPRPSEEPLRLLTVGRLEPVKDQGVLVDALARVRAAGIDATLTIVGEGSERAFLERRARELGVADAVTLAGSVGQDRIQAFYADADVFCLSSRSEGIPVVIMEAFAAGLPVVATDVGAVGELVEPGRSGLLVAPGSPEELADALIAIAAARERWSEMGRAGRAKVEREFTLPASIDALQALFAAAARAPR